MDKIMVEDKNELLKRIKKVGIIIANIDYKLNKFIKSIEELNGENKINLNSHKELKEIENEISRLKEIKKAYVSELFALEKISDLNKLEESIY